MLLDGQAGEAADTVPGANLMAGRHHDLPWDNQIHPFNMSDSEMSQRERPSLSLLT